MFDKAMIDLALLDERVNNGEDRQAVIAEMLSKAEFNKWYEHILEEANKVLH